MKFITTKEYDVQRMYDYIKRLVKNKAKVEVVQIKQTRSTSQNRLYWMWLNCISQETGQDPEDVHEVLKSFYLTGKFIKVGNLGQNVKPSTTKLNTKEFTDYLDKIKLWASEEMGITLLDPNDKLFEDFKFMYDERR